MSYVHKVIQCLYMGLPKEQTLKRVVNCFLRVKKYARQLTTNNDGRSVQCIVSVESIKTPGLSIAAEN